MDTLQPTRNLSELVLGDVSVDDDGKIAVGSIEYFLLPCKENFLSFLASGPTLALVYPTKPDCRFRTEVLDKDDVFQSQFFRNVIFYSRDENNCKLEHDTIQELKTWGTKTWTFLGSEIHVPPGPYIAVRGRTWQPWRVLDKAQVGINGRVIVPSRCYFTPSRSRPLDGARISIKDSIDIAEHKNSLCNRSWEDVYPPASKHAACIQALVDVGAILVSNTKLQAMIRREEPSEAVEFTAPFNPRADGYQVPSGSSHGRAAGIGSYDCGRKPAQYNECFSIRPTNGIISVEGFVSQFPEFDVPAPVKILYPLDFLPTPNGAQSQLIEKFIKGLEEGLGAGGYLYYYYSYANTEEFRTLHYEKHGVPAFARSGTYRHWLLNRVFETSNENCTTIMIFSIEMGLPNYRFNKLNMSPMVKAPELTAPLGATPYNSNVTKREKPLPIAASILGAPRTDLILADLVEKGMKAGGFLLKLKTGRFLH
ncbi:amidase signature enzyme [Patellaria atrata CBS 101060]|uniref:Amidase signature enzyme n=1 Tax=Patellaria atrata CBS 101060 TaxID=1346257 RepID=A0A9P4S727_9PEZI|nr:amidase signature enzyme [Patellaria atrata CBS 101060]